MDHNLPRLYTPNQIKIQEPLALDQAQAHYLKNVMRRNNGDKIRIFDGKNGEYLATITDIGKKSCILSPHEQIKPQPTQKNRVHLLFAPLPKNRMDILIEKAVEMGATDLHPILTSRTENRKINTDRLHTQIIEAAEQCECMHIPSLHTLTSLKSTLHQWTHTEHIQWACERAITPRKPLGHNTSATQAFLIGPAGGFDNEECSMLNTHPLITPITLGDIILRAETASILCLASIKIQTLKSE